MSRIRTATIAILALRLIVGLNISTLAAQVRQYAKTSDQLLPLLFHGDTHVNAVQGGNHDKLPILSKADDIRRVE
ncbi:hypothetical protein EF096_15985 [Pseudomonas neustonica]|jgi:hypothetical protein|uniref:Uncharacterized protein n=1 Tax=Pseudomonas neustonica TaxID=2487346 RepID=A0ABX9XET0_9PSED|nr:hypothetical protein EF099_16450 [Pseudomonas sp. SSM44]ROZ82156.1 hypothetical protein EF096_15985 [Pseudomonas neustonica]